MPYIALAQPAERSFDGGGREGGLVRVICNNGLVCAHKGTDNCSNFSPIYVYCNLLSYEFVVVLVRERLFFLLILLKLHV